MTTLIAHTIADTAQGRLRGSIKDGVHRFLGVAYGGATAQERHLMAPPPDLAARGRNKRRSDKSALVGGLTAT